MIALGLARLMRAARFGMTILLDDEKVSNVTKSSYHRRPRGPPADQPIRASAFSIFSVNAP
jgi:hypothetical protein